MKNINILKEKILDKAQILLKTDIRYLLSGGSWLGVSQVVSSLSAFLLSIAFANLLSPESYGIYKYILSITGLLLIPTLTGIDSAVTQAVAKGFEGTLITGLKTKMSWGVLGSLASIVFAIYYFVSGNEILSISFIIVSVFIPFIESLDLYNSLLTGKKLFKQFSSFNSIKKILSAISIILTIFFTKNIFIILFVYFFSTAILNLIFFIISKNKYKSNNEVDQTAMSFGKHVSLTHVFNIIIAELDKILVFHYLGGANLAIYTLALAPTDQIKALLKNLNILAVPKFATQSTQFIKENIWQKVKTLFMIISIIIIGYVIIAPYFFQIFFPKYTESTIYSQVLAISLIGAIIGTFLYTILETKKDTKGIYTYNIGGNIFNIIILFPFIYFFGLWGAILARFIGRFFAVMLGYAMIKRM